MPEITTDPTDLITPEVAAPLIGRGVSGVHYFCKTGRLEYVRVEPQRVAGRGCPRRRFLSRAAVLALARQLEAEEDRARAARRHAAESLAGVTR